MPGTGLSAPERESSPAKILPCKASTGICPLAASRPRARGRSKAVPLLRRPAGARFTVMREGGRRKPQARRAEKTRSRASRTAASARPTSVKPGRPWRTRSTSTSTGKASTPSRPALYNRMTISLPRAAGRPAGSTRPPPGGAVVPASGGGCKKSAAASATAPVVSRGPGHGAGQDGGRGVPAMAAGRAPVRLLRHGSPPASSRRMPGTRARKGGRKKARPPGSGTLPATGPPRLPRPSARPCRCGSSAGCCPCRPRTSRCARPWPGWRRGPRSPRSGSPANCRGCRP